MPQLQVFSEFVGHFFGLYRLMQQSDANFAHDRLHWSGGELGNPSFYYMLQLCVCLRDREATEGDQLG